jgi:hypothetical protein
VNNPVAEREATRWSVDEAFQRLLKHHSGNAQIARRHLHQAIIAGQITLLWRKADGPWIEDKPRMLALYIDIGTYDKPDGIHASLHAIGYIPGPDLSEHEWALSADEVEALCTPAPERQSHVAAEVEPKGDTEKYRWDKIATEFGLQIYVGDIDPLKISAREATEKMLTFCVEKWDMQPAESHMRAKVDDWLKAYKRKRK